MHRSSRPPPLSMRERSKRKTLAAVRDAAWSLFVEKGFDRATTREIAERAGVAAGTVFVHAKDKEELLVLVFQERVSTAFERGFDALATTGAELPLTERLARAFSVFFDEYAKQPELALKFLLATITLGGAHGAEQRAVEARFLLGLEAMLTSARDRGETRDDLDASGYARNLFAIYRFTVFRWLTSDQRRDASAGRATLASAISVAHLGARPRVKKRTSLVPGPRESVPPPRSTERPGKRTLAPPRLPTDLVAPSQAPRTSERPKKK
ncbi:MAG: TetR/AcrR family transcriptional regulator [Myxococcales bacterium]|nr:TetR/AcrR family transcriptional regulator [Myxococcales bacterium]